MSKEGRTYRQPDDSGHFGRFGGRYVPEVLLPALNELQAAYLEARDDEGFQEEYHGLLRSYVGRPTPLTYARRLTETLGGPHIYLKREDLCHTGAHKINNTIGQILLARRMGKTRIIAETGAGQHGVATATVCALFGIDCVVYMGSEDMERQRLNVHRMELLGAEVRPAESGSQTLKDATNEAIRDWVANVDETFYLIGSVVGPHPYPMMVRDFQRVIGDETRRQLREQTGREVPDALVACVGGGSNAMGLFYPFVEDGEVALFGVEAAGEGLDRRHAATLTRGTPGVLHGAMSMLLQDEEGQISLAHSISAGLDYPGVGPEHAFLKESGRVTYESIADEQAMEGVRLLARTEGIIPALETAHAVAFLQRLVSDADGREASTNATGTEPSAASNGRRLFKSDQTIVVNCSGRGDKDMHTIAAQRA